MAGDWLKVRHDLPDDPAVIAMAEELGIDQDAVVGKLIRFWIWADRQSVDGNVRGVTKMFLDAHVRHEGFAQALQKVGWLILAKGRVVIPEFERHMSQSAKQRALTAERVKRQRNGTDVTKSLPEKRREESSCSKKNKNVPRKFRFDESDMELAKHILEGCLQVVPTMKPPNLEAWANDIRLLREQDKREPEEIRALFDWANQDDFWRANILSPRKLRKQWDQLQAQRARGAKHGRQDHGSSGRIH